MAIDNFKKEQLHSHGAAPKSKLLIKCHDNVQIIKNLQTHAPNRLKPVLSVWRYVWMICTLLKKIGCYLATKKPLG